MKKLIIFAALAILVCSVEAKEINLTQDDCVFVKYSVPKKGITCSNFERAMRLVKKLKNVEIHKSSWGPFVAIGEL